MTVIIKRTKLIVKFCAITIESNIGNDNKVLILDVSIAVFADLAFTSGVTTQQSQELFFDLAKL